MRLPLVALTVVLALMPCSDGQPGKLTLGTVSFLKPTMIPITTLSGDSFARDFFFGETFSFATVFLLVLLLF